MKNAYMSAIWGRRVSRYAWVAGFLLIRTHYFLTAIVLPAFGWR
jgi:hypothetical protein